MLGNRFLITYYSIVPICDPFAQQPASKESGA